MKRVISEEWIEVAKALGVDPTAEIACPECGKATLETRDVSAGENTNVFERFIRCPACHAGLTMRKTRR